MGPREGMCAYIPHDIPACLHRRSCASAATGLAATKRTHGTWPTSTTRWPLMPPPPPAQPRLCRRVAWGPPHALRPLGGFCGGQGACSAGKEAQEVDPRERRGQRRLSARRPTLERVTQGHRHTGGGTGAGTGAAGPGTGAVGTGAGTPCAHAHGQVWKH